MGEQTRDFETLAAQAGIRIPSNKATPTVVPIFASTTYTYDTVQGIHAALEPGNDGYAYSRNANPTVVALEETMSVLEGAEEAIAFASGMAAIQTLAMAVGLETGDVILAAADLYGVTRALFTQLAGFGIETQYVNVLDRDTVEKTLHAVKPRLLYCESISNPLLHVADIDCLIQLAHKYGVLLVIDNTFATPFLLRPLEYGVDIVIHSATKYLAGHGDVTAGLVACNRSFGQRIRHARTVSGAVLSPFEAWLTLRGIRTLPLRMERHCQSAMHIATWLAAQRWVRRVFYPGLGDHPQHAVASRQFSRHFGGMVAFELIADRTGTLRFMDALRLITPGTTLGDAESLILYPPLSSHRSLRPEELKAIGIGDGLLRLSVGLESPDDLIRDLELGAHALRKG